MITRTPDNGHLEDLDGVGGHEPVWSDGDCPSCGSAPCGPHPYVLACVECAEDWPCPVVQVVIDELDRLVERIDASTEGCHREDANLLITRATELRGLA